MQRRLATRAQWRDICQWVRIHRPDLHDMAKAERTAIERDGEVWHPPSNPFHLDGSPEPSATQSRTAPVAPHPMSLPREAPRAAEQDSGPVDLYAEAERRGRAEETDRERARRWLRAENENPEPPKAA